MSKTCIKRFCVDNSPFFYFIYVFGWPIMRSMYTRTSHLNAAGRSLAILADYLRLSSSQGLTDENHISEDFFCGMLNMLFGYNLKNLNTQNKNHPAVDLGDAAKKISFQITIDSSSAKINETLKKFDAHNLKRDYDRVVVLIIGFKQRRYTAKFFCKTIKFSQDDIWDLEDLMGKIRDSDPSRLSAIADYLEKELDAKIEGSSVDPTRISDEDIRKVLQAVSDFVKTDGAGVNARSKLVKRKQGFMEEKNVLNNISQVLFDREIAHSLIYSKTIENFLKNPINRAYKELYVTTTNTIQEIHKKNLDDKIADGIEDIFRMIFNGMKIDYEKRDLEMTKLLIVLHNMYFNCDIGLNP